MCIQTHPHTHQLPTASTHYCASCHVFAAVDANHKPHTQWLPTTHTQHPPHSCCHALNQWSPVVSHKHTCTHTYTYTCQPHTPASCHALQQWTPVISHKHTFTHTWLPTAPSTHHCASCHVFAAMVACALNHSLCHRVPHGKALPTLSVHKQPTARGSVQASIAG